VGLSHQARLRAPDRLAKPSLCRSVRGKHLRLCWRHDASGLGKRIRESVCPSSLWRSFDRAPADDVCLASGFSSDQSVKICTISLLSRNKRASRIDQKTRRFKAKLHIT
jgi:hypothetical protein